MMTVKNVAGHVVGLVAGPLLVVPDCDSSVR